MMRKIYFDGYLPPSKWEVRRSRLVMQSKNLRDILALNPFGATRSPSGVFDHVKPSVLITTFTGRVAADKLPKPPFLVPAVIEALASCKDWGSLIQVVPGEADVYCAQDVRKNGGIVLTSDSDLLIQDLGHAGRVSFFWGLVYKGPLGTRALSAYTYSFHGINNQLGVKDVGGLPRVVFDQIHGRITFEEAVEKAKKKSTRVLTSPDYLDFLKEYEIDTSIMDDRIALDSISLDPRISEVVVQTLVMTDAGLVPDVETARGPEKLSIFLPVMIENRDIRSCWTTSTWIRQTAYGILQTLSSHRSKQIIEYRTLDTSSGRSGRQVDIPGPVETLDACVELTNTLKRLQKGIPPPNNVWFALAMLKDVENSVDEDQTSLSAILLSQANVPVASAYVYSLDLIHYTAQVQATYYSLRLLKQILDAVLALGRNTPRPFRELHESISSLPPIVAWPTVEDMPDILSSALSGDILSKVTDILGIPRIYLDKLTMKYTKSKQKKRKQVHDTPGRNSQGAAKRSPSINPFAILSESSQE
ncbi:hypothetical protein SLS62_009774 [Diatrype stigma]|uniref:Asteroid domain-containing protein n=1 Tax=Diatrype stigma TaxID=117547 RepID=A0AAN9UD87_9PEZI